VEIIVMKVVGKEGGSVVTGVIGAGVGAHMRQKPSLSLSPLGVARVS